MDHSGNMLNHSHGVTQAGTPQSALNPNYASFTWLDDGLCKTAILPPWSSCSNVRRDVIPFEFTSKGAWTEHT